MIKIIQPAVKQLIFVFLVFSFVLFLHSCKEIHRNSTHKDVSIESIKKGKELAKLYCQTCHQLPDPSLLDSKSWEKGVLPEMGPRLGIFRNRFQIYPITRDAYIGRDFYPSIPMVKLSEWQNILDYYEATSPDSLPPQKRKYPIEIGLPFFKVEIPKINYERPATCYVKINSKDSLHPIIIADAIKKNLYFVNRNLQITDSIKTGGPIVNIDFEKNKLLACNIGILNPNNGKFGKGSLLISIQTVNHTLIPQQQLIAWKDLCK